MTAEGSFSKDDQYSKEMLEKLAARLRKIRKERGYPNYEKFAIAHNLTRSAYGNYEKGANISFVSLVRILKALDITLAEFFSEGF